jgi:diacylglycerol kinase (ATP)
MRIVVIVSGASRLSPAQVNATLASGLNPDVAFEVQVANSSSEATMAAVQAAESAALVVAVGGDGTVADVATGIYGSNAALAIVPAGSTNIVARSLGIPADPAAALALICGSYRLRSIDVGRCDDRSFIHMAGAGFDAALFSATSPLLKRRLGWIAYIPAAVVALRLPPSDVRITADDTVLKVRSSLVLVANGSSAIAPEYQVYPGIEVDDGWLDVIAFTPSSPAEIAATLSRAGKQQLDRSPHVTHTRAQTVSIDAAPPLPVELDGDPRGTTPRQFSIVHSGLQVVTPVDRSDGRSDYVRRAEQLDFGVDDMSCVALLI